METIDRMSQGFMAAKVVMAAAELRLFDALGGEDLEAAAIAARISGRERATGVLLDALAGLGVIEKSASGTYRLRPDHAAHLTGDAPFAAMLRHRNRLFGLWGRLEEIVRGAAPGGAPSVLDDEHANESFILAMAHAALSRISLVLDRLPLAKARVFTDVGGGPATYLEAALLAHPHLRGVLLDVPLTVGVARRRLDGAPVASRLSFVPWCFFDDPAPAGVPAADVMLVSQVLHAEGPERNRRLLAALLPLLAPGGVLAIHENACEPSRTEPLPAVLFAINMLVSTGEGRTYTIDELRALGSEAGLRTRDALRLDERSVLVSFEKPV